MGMNLKNEDVQRLANEVSARTGLNLTQSIRLALREKLERLDREQDVEAVMRRVNDIIERSGPTASGVTSDHSDLYDERGLPA